jgi:trehalose 6-phosphate synthase
MRALFAYDLVGFQNHADLQHFAQYVQAEATAEPVGPNQFRAFNRTVHANAFPIGIDVAEFQRLGQAKEARDTYESTKAEYSRRRLLIGWTGWIIPRACRSASAPSANCCACIRKTATAPPAADRLAQPRRRGSLRRHPARAGKPVRLHQRRLRRLRLDADPLHPPHRGAPPPAGFVPRLRGGAGDALRDGMNLVAKEFVAAQDRTIRACWCCRALPGRPSR